MIASTLLSPHVGGVRSHDDHDGDGGGDDGGMAAVVEVRDFRTIASSAALLRSGDGPGPCSVSSIPLD